MRQTSADFRARASKGNEPVAANRMPSAFKRAVNSKNANELPKPLRVFFVCANVTPGPLPAWLNDDCRRFWFMFDGEKIFMLSGFIDAHAAVAVAE